MPRHRIQLELTALLSLALASLMALAFLGLLWQRVDLLSRHQRAMGDLTLTMAEVQHKLLDRQVREAWL